MNLRKLFDKLFDIKRPLFMDLDGTIIRTSSGDTFPRDYDDWEMMPGVVEALKKYHPTIIHIVSNQGGIEKGFVNEAMWLSKVKKIAYSLGNVVKCPVTIAYCPSDRDSFYRKPNEGMVVKYMAGVATSDCLMVGDASGLEGRFSDSDRVCALNAGIPYMDISEFIDRYTK